MTETASHHWRTLCCRRQDPWFSASPMVRTSFRSDQAHHCSLSEWISQLFLEAEHLFLSLLGADTETTASEAKTLQGAVYWVTALNPPMFIPLILQGLPYNKRSLSCHHLFVPTFCARPLYKIDLCFSVCMRYLLSGVPYPFTTPFPFRFHGIYFSSVQSFSRVWLSATPWTAARQASLSIINSQSLLKLISIVLVMPSNHLILLFLSPPTFSLSQHQGLFQWVGSSHQVAKVLEFQLQHVLPVNIEDWFPLGLTGCISLQSKTLSRVFSNTTVQKQQF